MCSAYELNKQGDNIQPWWALLDFEPIHCSVSRSDYCFLIWIQVSQETDNCIPISLRIFYSLLWSTQSKALAESMKQTAKLGYYMNFIYLKHQNNHLIFSIRICSALQFWSGSICTLANNFLKANYFSFIWKQFSYKVLFSFLLKAIASE